MLPESVVRETRGWIANAESDFKASALLWVIADAPLDVIVFHCQQGAEKMLKALLTARGIPFGKTHDLDMLIRLLPSESSAAALKDISDLTDAAVATRYPGDMETLDRKVVGSLMTKANQVRQVIIE